MVKDAGWPLADGMPERMVMDARIHAATELLGFGALVNRSVTQHPNGKGLTIIYGVAKKGVRSIYWVIQATQTRRCAGRGRTIGIGARLPRSPSHTTRACGSARGGSILGSKLRPDPDP
jgi:hypothetical protein